MCTAEGSLACFKERFKWERKALGASGCGGQCLPSARPIRWSSRWFQGKPRPFEAKVPVNVLTYKKDANQTLRTTCRSERQAWDRTFKCIPSPFRGEALRIWTWILYLASTHDPSKMCTMRYALFQVSFRELWCNAAKWKELTLPCDWSRANKDTGPDLQTAVSSKWLGASPHCDPSASST